MSEKRAFKKSLPLREEEPPKVFANLDTLERGGWKLCNQGKRVLEEERGRLGGEKGKLFSSKK